MGVLLVPRHIKTDSAKLKAAKMPLLEIFISEFLESVNHVVKRGLRSTYTHKEENLFALRGKLMMAQHLRQNMFRKDRFYTHHDEFSNNRPENRLLHSALVDVMLISSSQTNQQLARELQFVFADVPTSTHYGQDFNQVLLDRGMGHYSDAISWARLILVGQSPLTGSGTNLSTSLLFPMEAVFEAFVGKHLAKQLTPNFHLKKQSRRFSLVQHLEKSWFWLKPDFLVCSRTDSGQKLVLDAKWKLIDSNQANGTKKYGLSQTDFYQLYAYGQSYLNGEGDLVLIYPKTERFKEALEVFFFSPSMDTKKLRLWVLPFCLSERKLILPKAESCPEILTSSFAAIEGDRTMRVPN